MFINRRKLLPHVQPRYSALKYFFPFNRLSFCVPSFFLVLLRLSVCLFSVFLSLCFFFLSDFFFSFLFSSSSGRLMHAFLFYLFFPDMFYSVVSVSSFSHFPVQLYVLTWMNALCQHQRNYTDKKASWFRTLKWFYSSENRWFNLGKVVKYNYISLSLFHKHLVLSQIL